MVVLPKLKSSFCHNIYSWLGEEQMDSCLSLWHECEVKCNWHCPGFELWSPGPFPTMIIITQDTALRLDKVGDDHKYSTEMQLPLPPKDIYMRTMNGSSWQVFSPNRSSWRRWYYHCVSYQLMTLAYFYVLQINCFFKTLATWRQYIKKIWFNKYQTVSFSWCF